MKKRLFFYLLLFLSGSVHGQNLIPNPSFEDVNVCQKYNEPCSPKAWRSTLLKGFVYGEYLGEKKSKTHDPIIPPDGNRFISLRMFNKGKANDRTFIQVPLLCPLEKGREYRIFFQFYTPFYHIEQIGIAFIDKMKIHKNNDAVLDTKPQAVFSINSKIKHRNWYKLSSIYTATGEETGFILGNFQSDDNTKIKPLLKVKRNERVPNRVYYIFDDFKLEAVSQEETAICNSETYLAFLYQDSSRHIPNHPILTIDDYPVSSPIVPEQTDIDTTTNEVVISDSIQIGNRIVTNEEDFVMEDITFENNSTVLKTEALPSIQEIISFLSSHPQYQVSITGHTDNVGSSDFNLTLSKARAQTIADLLLRAGIDANRIAAQGLGESEPITDNNTSTGKAKNRRVTFRFFRH